MTLACYQNGQRDDQSRWQQRVRGFSKKKVIRTEIIPPTPLKAIDCTQLHESPWIASKLVEITIETATSSRWVKCCSTITPRRVCLIAYQKRLRKQWNWLCWQPWKNDSDSVKTQPTQKLLFRRCVKFGWLTLKIFRVKFTQIWPLFEVSTLNLLKNAFKGLTLNLSFFFQFSLNSIPLNNFTADSRTSLSCNN